MAKKTETVTRVFKTKIKEPTGYDLGAVNAAFGMHRMARNIAIDMIEEKKQDWLNDPANTLEDFPIPGSYSFMKEFNALKKNAPVGSPLYKKSFDFLEEYWAATTVAQQAVHEFIANLKAIKTRNAKKRKSLFDSELHYSTKKDPNQSFTIQNKDFNKDNTGQSFKIIDNHTIEFTTGAR